MTPVVAGYFQILAEDLAAARLLTATVPRASAYHLQQAAEKLVKAILSAERIHVTSDHNIGQLAARLPDGHAWKADLVDLDHLSQFGTTYRYPTERGRVAAPPDRAELEHYIGMLTELADEARDWCRQIKK